MENRLSINIKNYVSTKLHENYVKKTKAYTHVG